MEVIQPMVGYLLVLGIVIFIAGFHVGGKISDQITKKHVLRYGCISFDDDESVYTCKRKETP